MLHQLGGCGPFPDADGEGSFLVNDPPFIGPFQAGRQAVQKPRFQGVDPDGFGLVDLVAPDLFQQRADVLVGIDQDLPGRLGGLVQFARAGIADFDPDQDLAVRRGLRAGASGSERPPGENSRYSRSFSK
jgi:hypothetical protein